MPNVKINKVNNDRCPEKQVRFLCGSATVMRCMRSVGSPALPWKYGSTRMDEYRDDTFFLCGGVLIFAQSQREQKGGLHMKKNAKIVGALAVAVIVLLGVWFCLKQSGVAGSKELDVQVVFADASSKDFHISTDAAYLGEALKEEGLIEGEDGPYGMFVTSVDGVAIDDSLQQWWCVTKGGESVNTGVDTTPIEDGDHFELTLTTGY